MRLVDITVPVRPGMPVYPGDPEFSVERVSSISAGGSSNISRLVMGTHTGTHIDAPLHFIDTGRSIGEIPLDAVVGTATVLEIDDPVSIKAEHLETAGLRAGSRVLLKTRNSQLWRKDGFQSDFVYLETEAARYLAELPARCVGIDYLSVGGFKADGREVHDVLLGAGVWAIEGLDLSDAEPGDHTLVCLPLRLEGLEASPVRAILIDEGT